MEKVVDFGDHFYTFLAFFIPGFIAFQIYSLFISGDDIEIGKRLPAIVGYSAIHYAVTGWVFLRWPSLQQSPVAIFIEVFVLPLLWAPIVLLIRDWSTWYPIFFKYKVIINPLGAIRAMTKPEARPWDRLFRRPAAEIGFVRIKLKNGAFVGGYFATNSASATFPCESEIYIAQAYELSSTGEFLRPLQSGGSSHGIWVSASEISVLEHIGVE